MTPELKLAATAAGLLLLLAGSIAWVVYDWIKQREKKKRREDYNEWFNMQYARSLDFRAETISRCWTRHAKLLSMLDEIQSDEYWEQWFNEKWAEHHAPLNPNGRIGRPKIDGYYYYQED